MYAVKLNREDVDRGYVICGCGKYAHIVTSSALSKLPKDYEGELCKECSCWVASVEKLGIREQVQP